MAADTQAEEARAVAFWCSEGLAVDIRERLRRYAERDNPTPRQVVVALLSPPARRRDGARRPRAPPGVAVNVYCPNCEATVVSFTTRGDDRNGRGFALQRVYTADRSLDASIAVRDGDLVLVPRGYHTVSAAPGYELYNLNVMAGPVRRWCVSFDPDHERLRSG